MTRPAIYLSYATPDQSWAERVRAGLIAIGHQERLDCLDRRHAETGKEEETAVRETIGQAALAVLLVSISYLNSPRVKEVEVPVLRERQRAGTLRLLPILVRPCPWRTVPWLDRMQIFPAGDRALSAGNDHQIDLDLTDLAYKVNEELP